MGAKDLLANLCQAGLTIAVDGNQLVIRPASKLTDNLRSALVKAKPELLALLASPDRPYRLTPAEADAAHSEPWDDTTITAFVARVSLFLRLGVNAADADDLAERLHLRDVQGDDRAMCLECRQYQHRACEAHRIAGLAGPSVPMELATKPQRCAASERRVQ